MIESIAVFVDAIASDSGKLSAPQVHSQNRKMWKVLLSLVAALCWADSIQEIDVAIAGLGYAGSTIAVDAKMSGRVPVVFESRDSFGGRAHRFKVGDHYVPKGAGWQSGLGPLQPMTKRLRVCNISSTKVNWGRWRDYCKNGQECEESWDEFETSYACAAELSTEMGNLGLPPVSLDTGLKLCGWKATTDAQFIYETSTVNYEFAEGSTATSLTGALPLLTYIVYKDGDKFITDPRSSQEGVGCWLDRYGIGRESSYNVNYNSPIVNINTDERIVTLHNGSRYRYNVLFNTIPNGVLAWNQIREDGSLFTPKLSAERVRALHGYHTPDYVKIFLQFPSDFWNTFKPNIQYFNIWPDALHSCTVWQNLDLPNFWPGSKLIYVTCTTPQSDMGETLSSGQWKNMLMPQLRNVFGSGIPEPTLVKVARWLDDPNFRGTYSNVAVEFTLDKFNAFYQPLGPNGTHIFAGEAYCYLMFGYMHSAILSGHTAWCEYQVRIGAWPSTRECRKEAIDPDGKHYPNVCWPEGLPVEAALSGPTSEARRAVVPRQFRRRQKIAQHNSNMTDAAFQEHTAKKFNRAMELVSA